MALSATGNRRWRKRLSLLSILLIVAFSTQASARDDLIAWTLELEEDLRFQRALDERIILVGTDRHLFGIDMMTGKQLWRLRNVEVDAADVAIIPWSNVVLISEGHGGEFEDKESNVSAVDFTTGEKLWESPTIKQRVLSVVPDLQNERVLVVTASMPPVEIAETSNGSRDSIFSIRKPVESCGSSIWDVTFGLLQSIPRTKKKRSIRGCSSLSGYHTPVFHDSSLYLLYDGIRCYDASTGKQKWSKRFGVIEGDLAKSFAEPAFDEQYVYATGEGKVRAFRLSDGHQVWETND